MKFDNHGYLYDTLRSLQAISDNCKMSRQRSEAASEIIIKSLAELKKIQDKQLDLYKALCKQPEISWEAATQFEVDLMTQTLESELQQSLFKLKVAKDLDKLVESNFDKLLATYRKFVLNYNKLEG